MGSRSDAQRVLSNSRRAHKRQAAQTVRRNSHRKRALKPHKETFERHVKLVYLVINRMWKSTPILQRLGDITDAYQVGHEGLHRALLGYDLTQGYAFSTYACVVISRFVMERSLNSGLIKTPRTVTRDLFKRSGEGIVPSTDAKRLDACEKAMNVISITKADGHYNIPEPAYTERHELYPELHEAIDRLPRSYRVYILKRYGLDGQPALSPQELRFILWPLLGRNGIYYKEHLILRSLQILLRLAGHDEFSFLP